METHESNKQILSLHDIMADRRNFFWYWCNARGELDPHNMYNGIPHNVQALFDTLWSMDYELPCMVCQYNIAFGIGLSIPLLDWAPLPKDDRLKGLHLSEDQLTGAYAVAGQMTARHLCPVLPESTQVFFDRHDDGGDEILVFIPEEDLCGNNGRLDPDLLKKMDALLVREGKIYFEALCVELAKAVREAFVPLELLLFKEIRDKEKAADDPKNDAVDYDRGSHDALVWILNCLGIPNDEEYYCE